MKNLIIDILIFPFALVAELLFVCAGILIIPAVIIGHFTGNTKINKTEKGLTVEFKSCKAD